MTAARWEHFPHQADVGVRGIGPSQAEAFEQAALALTSVVADLKSVRAEEQVDIACEGPNAELLLIDWLNAVIYEMATRRMLFSRFKVGLSGERLEGRAWGEKLEPERHRPAVEVKAATYHQLAVRRDRDGSWIAQCVVDV
ncbi:MAG: archease [Verrucomicrobiota bacterium]